MSIAEFRKEWAMKPGALLQEVVSKKSLTMK